MRSQTGGDRGRRAGGAGCPNKLFAKGARRERNLKELLNQNTTQHAAQRMFQPAGRSRCCSELQLQRTPFVMLVVQSRGAATLARAAETHLPGVIPPSPARRHRWQGNRCPLISTSCCPAAGPWPPAAAGRSCRPGPLPARRLLRRGPFEPAPPSPPSRRPSRSACARAASRRGT